MFSAEAKPALARPSRGHPGGRPSERAKRERRFERARIWALRLGGLAVLAAVWQAWASQQHSLLLPDFVATLRATLDLIFGGAIWEPLMLSNQAMLVGFAVGAITAVPLGLLMARRRGAESFLDVYLNILMVTPMAALIPLFMMALGLDLSARAAVVYVFAAPVMAINTRAGVRTIDPSLLEMARSFGANELQIWRKVLLPGALPAIMTGVRLGLSRAINGMLLAELLLMAVGVGRLILDYRGRFEAAYLFAVVVVLMLESILLLVVARWVEARAAPWATVGGDE